MSLSICTKRIWKKSGMKTTKIVMINATKLNEERYRRIWTKRNAKKASNSVPVFWSLAPRMQRCQKSRKASLSKIGKLWTQSFQVALVLNFQLYSAIRSSTGGFSSSSSRVEISVRHSGHVMALKRRPLSQTWIKHFLQKRCPQDVFNSVTCSRQIGQSSILIFSES